MNKNILKSCKYDENASSPEKNITWARYFSAWIQNVHILQHQNKATTWQEWVPVFLNDLYLMLNYKLHLRLKMPADKNKIKQLAKSGGPKLKWESAALHVLVPSLPPYPDISGCIIVTSVEFKQSTIGQTWNSNTHMNICTCKLGHNLSS